MRRAWCAAALVAASFNLLAADDCVDVLDLDSVESAAKAEGAPAGAPAPEKLTRAVDDSKARLDKIHKRNQERLQGVIHPASDAVRKRMKEAPPAEKSFAKTVDGINNQNVADLKKIARLRNYVAERVPATSCLLQKAQANLDSAFDETRFSAGLASHLSPQYGLYLGPNYSLGGNGSWRVGAEALARFDTEVFTVHDPGYDFLKHFVPESGWMRGFAEVSYQAINALQEDASGSAVPSDNVFASTGGYLRMNAGLQLHQTDWWGVQLGGGFSSLPNNDNVTHLEPRGFAGLHFQTLYNDGALASLFVGGAYDRFWRSEVFNDPTNPLAGTHAEKHFGRYNVDGLLFLPGEAMNFHLVTRLFADGPLDGKGPADVRVSILLYYDFNSWLGTFLPIKDTKDATEALSRL